MSRRPTPLADHAARVLAHVAEIDGCWRWTGHLSPDRGTGVLRADGYGQIGRNLLAHRVIWEHLRGSIPGGLVLDHECHNLDTSCVGGTACPHRLCVNPDHLALKSRGDNLRASSASVASVNAAKTHCPSGHEYDDGNTYRRPSEPRHRYCRACIRAAQAKASA